MANNFRREPPAYSHHQPSGQSRVRIDGRDHHLGAHHDPESHAQYGRRT